MSFIVAGSKCKECEKEYHYSFGHPKWFPTSMSGNRRKITDPELIEKYNKMSDWRSSGKCYECYFGRR